MNLLPTIKLSHIPQRTCLACGRKTAKADLLRLSRNVAGQVVLDLQQRLPGRGAYVCPTPACAQLLIKKNALHHGFRTKISAEDYAMVMEFIQQHAFTRIDQSARPGEAGA
jgi:predicted RNA-binding protein YlxR (DUF448 family)